MQTINSTLIDLWQQQDIVSFYIDLCFVKMLVGSLRNHDNERFNEQNNSCAREL